VRFDLGFRLEVLLLNGTGVKGDVSSFAGLQRLVRLDVADCPALSGDPQTLRAFLGDAFTVNC
jgi:hypothetical protein